MLTCATGAQVDVAVVDKHVRESGPLRQLGSLPRSRRTPLCLPPLEPGLQDNGKRVERRKRELRPRRHSKQHPVIKMVATHGRPHHGRETVRSFRVAARGQEEPGKKGAT